MALEKHFTVLPRVLPEWGDMVIIPVPDEVVQFFRKAGVKRFICTLNDEYEMPCALHAQSGGARYIMLSKRVRSEVDIDLSGMLAVKLTEDKSEFGYPVPEEWQAILDFDEEAATIFRTLSSGKQRSILHLVSSAKREETRISRAVRIAENLKLGIRKPQEFLKNH